MKRAILSLLLTILPAASVLGTGYYVAPPGNDSANGSIATPWRTISYGSGQVRAGDTLYIRAGLWLGVEAMATLQHSGTSGNPVTIRNYPGETPVQDCQSFGLTTGRKGFAANSQNYMVVDGLTVRNAACGNSGGMGLNGAVGSVVQNCAIHDQWEPAAGSFCPAIRIDDSQGLLIRNCLASNLNEVGDRGAGLWVGYRSDGAIAENCEIADSGIGAYDKYDNWNNTLRYCYVHDCEYGYEGNMGAVANSGGIRVYGNVFARIRLGGLHPFNAQNVQFYNNTLYRCGYSSTEANYSIFVGSPANNPHFQIWNNISYKRNPSGNEEWDIFNFNNGAPDYWDYNCYYPSVRIRLDNNNTELSFYSLAAFQAWTGYTGTPPGYDAHSYQTSAPQFVDEANDDFHLAPGSVCLGTGVNRASGLTDRNIGAYISGDEIIGRLPAGVPTIAITQPSSTGSHTTTNATVIVGGTAGDDVTVTSIAWTNTATGGRGIIAGGTSWSIPSVALAEGANMITVRAFDGDGNVGVDAITVTRWTPAVNVPPVANAGVNQSVAQGATVNLNGAASSDPDARPSPLTYSWTRTAGPSVTLSGGTTASPSFTAPTVAAQTALTFRLTVSDGAATDTADVTVTVNPPGNLAPAANAGNDHTVTVGNLVTLSSTGSSDSDGTIVSYLWTQTAGSSITLNGGNTGTATFTPAQTGAYAFRLTVTDDDGATGADAVTITVQPAQGNNNAPVADAGEDRTIAVRSDVLLDAGGSYDPDAGTVLAYAWVQVSGPTVTLQGVNSALAGFVASEAATYVFRVTVSDGLLSAQDDVTIVAEHGGTGNTEDGPDQFQVIPNRVAFVDVSTVRVVGPASLAGRVFVYSVSGATVGSIELLEDGNGAGAELRTGPAVVPGLYLFVPEASEDGIARLVITP